MPFATLGLGLPIRLAGIAASTSIFLPVPDGLTATTLMYQLSPAPGANGA